jgi:protein-S-isoprenylcysteine O-methyltransferase Ste14
VLPGFSAVYLPWRFFGLRDVRIDVSDPRQWLGMLGIGAGTILLLTCIWEFAKRGRGTLSPADPPRHLVVSGLYRFVRNPMYMSVTLIIFGEVLLTSSRSLFVYWIAWFTIVNVFVMGYEEPTLRHQFGGEYEQYTRHVGRWFPRLTPWRS